MSTSTEQKLNELKKLFSTSMLALKQSHEETRRPMGTEISKLKEDLAAAKEQQEDATERAVKLTRRERNLDFNRKATRSNSCSISKSGTTSLLLPVSLGS